MKAFVFVLISCILFFGCGNSYPKAENAFDGGREFIDGCLKGDFERARFYLLKNETNNQQMDKLVNNYRNESSDQKKGLQEASINVLEEDTESDSVHIIKYKNSFDNIPHKVKAVQTAAGWQVDLSYTFSGNS